MSAAGKAPLPSGPRYYRMRGAVLLFFSPATPLWYGGWRNAAGKPHRWGGVCRRVPAMHCGAPGEHRGSWAPDAAAGKQVVAGLGALVKLLLEKSPSSSAKAALAAKRKCWLKDRQLTDRNATLLVSLAHLSEARKTRLRDARAAQRVDSTRCRNIKKQA